MKGVGQHVYLTGRGFVEEGCSSAINQKNAILLNIEA